MHLYEHPRHVDDFASHDGGDRRDANRAVAVSAIGLGITGVFELAVAVLTGSVGLLGDAFHNLADVSTSLVVVAGLRFSARSPSATHPYGWDRAEDIAGLGVAVVIWGSAAFAAIVSIHKLTESGDTSHPAYGIAAAAVGIVGNQVVARYKMRVGKRIHSTALVADAQHSWLDALSSAGAMLGLVGVAAGLPWADGVAGLLVTLFVVHVGFEVTGDLLSHLTDGVEPGIVESAEQAAEAIDGVDHAHARARWSGRSLLIEVEGYVQPDATVATADELGRAVERAVAAAVPYRPRVVWRATAA